MSSSYFAAAKNKGGIKSLKLIDASDFLSCNYSSSLSCFTEYNLAEGAEFCNISYFFESAYYKETTTLDKGHARVKHELSFVLCDADESTISFIKKVVSGQIKSLVAIVTDNNSVSYLVGYSQDFLCERALKLSSSVRDTAYSSSSRPMNSLVFSVEDTQVAQQICVL